MFGDQIKKLRIARNLSQVTVAKDLSVTKQTVSNWENNNILPSVEMLRKIAIYFSCSSDYLLELNTDRQFVIEVNDLTVTQISHIQQLVADLSAANKHLN